MNVQDRLAEAVRSMTEAAPAPSIDLSAIREQARRRTRRRGIVAAAATAAVVSAVGGVILTEDAESPVGPPAGPSRVDPDGVHAFLDRDAGLVHLGDQRIELAKAPGLETTGLAIPGGIVYQTPEQEVRLVSPSGQQRMLAPALGSPPEGFAPSLAYDQESGVVVALRLTADALRDGRPLIAAYDPSTGEELASTQLMQMYEPEVVVLGGASDGVAAVNYRGAYFTGVVDWTWTTPDRGGEWRTGRVFDVSNRVVLGDWGTGRAHDPRLHVGRWRYVSGRPGERLSPSGEWRVSTAWQRWPDGGPAERTTSGDDRLDFSLPDLPRGSRISLSYDTDGSVLAAVASGPGFEDAVRVFDCNRATGSCDPIGRVDGIPEDPLFLDGITPSS